jgi:truncated hemoglobin YjbI
MPLRFWDPEHGPTLFQRLGGWTSLSRIADKLYAKVYADELLAPYFKGVSAERLAQKQVSSSMEPFLPGLSYMTSEGAMIEHLLLAIS